MSRALEMTETIVLFFARLPWKSRKEIRLAQAIWLCVGLIALGCVFGIPAGITSLGILIIMVWWSRRK
ncbi:MAG: hypothetical protein KKE20_05560 [Nanoarchaeota archaeon]|nr:hypothetical protein [Nanoarchaeota archaeon]